MTLYFCGHPFKYELEGICKLFFPLIRFTHVFDPEGPVPEGDFVRTIREKGKEQTRLCVEVSLGGASRSREAALPNTLPEYEKECERVLCVELYRLLSEWLGIQPSWGILTGVRPVNIIQRERAAGRPDEETARFLREEYLVSPEKLRLAFTTADVQSGLLADLPERSYSLYISIPFCASRCSYCSFVSHAITTRKATDKIEEYLALLCQELELTAQAAKQNRLKLDTIYIGGGTPTALSAAQLKQVTDAVSAYFDVPSAREYTIEAGRADTITREKLEVIRASGAGRISVNPQTFNDDVLRRIGRRHTAAEAVECYRMAREMGFDTINMDFIAGLPGDTLESFQHTIEEAIRLSPSNITVHTLSIKRSADLFSEEGIADYVKTNVTDGMTAFAREALLAAGYRPYYLYRQKNTIGNLENVGFAKPGAESLYNVYIMDEIQTILACGAGGVTKLVSGMKDPASGKNPIERIFNFKYHFEYIDRFDQIKTRKEQVTDFYANQEK